MPRGSILCPLFFLVYTFDFKHLLADDISFLIAHNANAPGDELN